jgi:hypothetical protein
LNSRDFPSTLATSGTAPWAAVTTPTVRNDIKSGPRESP